MSSLLDKKCKKKISKGFSQRLSWSLRETAGETEAEPLDT